MKLSNKTVELLSDKESDELSRKRMIQDAARKIDYYRNEYFQAKQTYSKLTCGFSDADVEAILAEALPPVKGSITELVMKMGKDCDRKPLIDCGG